MSGVSIIVGILLLAQGIRLVLMRRQRRIYAEYLALHEKDSRGE